MQQVGYMLLGAVLSISGGIIGSFISAWANARWVRYNRMQEIIAQKKIDANQHAYKHIKNIESLLIQGTLEQVKNEINANETWLFSNALFLPHNFTAKWFTLRNGVNEVLLDTKNKSMPSQRVVREEEKLRTLVEQILEIIYKDMDMKRVEARPFVDNKG